MCKNARFLSRGLTTGISSSEKDRLESEWFLAGIAFGEREGERH